MHWFIRLAATGASVVSFLMATPVRAAIQVASPVIVATRADLENGNRANTRPDASTSSFMIQGQRFWLTSIWGRDTQIEHALTEGDVNHPFATDKWLKSTCKRVSNFCVDGSGFAFTRVVPQDVQDLWFVGVYQPDPSNQELLGIIHEESVGGTDRQRIGLAWSSDGGNTWAYLGRIVSQYGDPSGSNIQGAPYLIKDDYLYVYYADTGDGSAPAAGLGVSRARLVDVLSAARSGSVGVGLWYKYYAGNFTEPSLGGRSTLLGPFGINHTQAIYSSLTGKYYLSLSMMSGDGQDSFVKLFESTDAIQWSLSAVLADESSGSLRPGGGYQYCSIVDPDGYADGAAKGQFDVYCVKDPLPENIPQVGLYRWRVNLSGFPRYYRQSVDYSANQGPVWWYQSGKDNVIYDMTFDGSFWRGIDRWSAIYNDSMHPAAYETPVLKWVAPRAGRVRIEGTVRDADIACGNGVDVSVVHNGTEIYAASIENGDTVGKSIDTFRDVATGDGLFFMVAAHGTDYYCDGTRWDPSVIYQ